MANDNPKKYLEEGGIHIERLTREDAEAEGLDPDKPQIMFALKEKQNVICSIVPGDYALKIAEAIKKLVDISL
jgi:hypothetical protein